MRKVRQAILLLLLAVSACQRDGGESFQEPQYGTDKCAECGSTVQDPNFAAFYELRQGARKVFDDPGCLFRSLRAETGRPAESFFHEHAGTRWLSGSGVSFAKTPATQSPQGYGWAAFGSFGDAQTAVTSAGTGEILSFAQAKEKVGADSP
jgi:hypothetical protein